MEIKDKIKQIKYLRLKPEERFLLDMMNGIKPFISKNYPKSIFWKKDDDILFEQDYKNGWLRCNYNKIWSVFSKKYEYSYPEIQSFIKSVVDKDTNLGGLTPVSTYLYEPNRVDKDTNLVGLTPTDNGYTKEEIVDKDTNSFSSISTENKNEHRKTIIDNSELNSFLPKIIQQNRIDKIKKNSLLPKGNLSPDEHLLILNNDLK